MTDWREAGRKADARYVLNLYRRAFASDAKRIARERTIEALRAAGVETVLDLWGGGVSAESLVAAGFRVVSVDDGSMDLRDSAGRPISAARKRRALEYAGAEGGYEVRFGKAERFAAEADGAYLDFCGPWSKHTRRTVAACRHMKAVAVTLTPDHDMSTDASSMHERQMAYQLFLKMSWADRPVWEYMQGQGTVRRLLDYRRAGGFGVYLYLLSRKRIKLTPMKMSDREKTRPDMHQRHLEIKRDYWHRLSPEKRQQRGKRVRELHKLKYHTDPEFRTAHLLKVSHRNHLRGAVPRKPCVLCEEGRLGPASPA